MAQLKVLEIRKEKGLTQEQIAQRSNITRQYYSAIETGVRRPSVAVAKRIASALEVDWTIFFEDIGNETLTNDDKTA